MVFSSLLFLLLFLAVVMITYMAVKTLRAKNIVLLVGSLIFYAWSGPLYLLLLCGMVAVCWFGALLIRYYKSNERLKRLSAAATVFACLLLLGIFKYAVFFMETWQAIFGVPAVIPNIVLPIGISFYTFQLISYVIDVYRGEVAPQKKYHLLLLYASLFHQCIAGPIVRYQTVAYEIEHRQAVPGGVSRGITRFTIGLAKKALLANYCGSVADVLFPTAPDAMAQIPALGVWLGAIYYMLQIYLDFSAYSDMAIGMGLMVGFHYEENFNYPYMATSVTDFWRRWHISLSTFFRDYVYIPLGGNRCSRARHVFNLLLVWFLTGLWHGASWNYVLWGLYFFLFLVAEKYLLRLGAPTTNGRYIGRRAYLLLIVLFGWFLFRFEDMTALGYALRGLFLGNGSGFIGRIWNVTVKTQLLGNLWFLPIALLACTPIVPLLHRKLCDAAQKHRAWHVVRSVLLVVLPPVLLCLSVLSLVGDSYNPFLYFQF